MACPITLLDEYMKKQWLASLQERPQKSLLSLLKTWGKSNAIVLNDTLARDEHKLIF